MVTVIPHNDKNTNTRAGPEKHIINEHVHRTRCARTYSAMYDVVPVRDIAMSYEFSGQV